MGKKNIRFRNANEMIPLFVSYEFEESISTFELISKNEKIQTKEQKFGNENEDDLVNCFFEEEIEEFFEEEDFQDYYEQNERTIINNRYHNEKKKNGNSGTLKRRKKKNRNETRNREEKLIYKSGGKIMNSYLAQKKANKEAKITSNTYVNTYVASYEPYYKPYLENVNYAVQNYVLTSDNEKDFEIAIRNSITTAKIEETKIINTTKSLSKMNQNERKQAREKLLMELQFRDITPEDYDLLLELDEEVAPKTVNKTVLEKNPTKELDHDLEEICLICMENFLSGESIRTLDACAHFFHTSCIDKYLVNFSNQCPCCKCSI